jgi:hypothetical protein
MRRLFFILLFALFALNAFGQNLRDNPDYRESLRYKQLSEDALEEGEYKQAKEYAELSVEYARKSDAYISRRLAQYRANQLLQRAEALQGQVDRSGRKALNPEVYAEASSLVVTARSLYTGEQYPQSSESSRSAIALFEETFGGVRSSGTSGLPAAYLVRRLPGAEDCFWRIAGYDFVYGDTSAWKPIYEANKSKLPQPENPDLILPGMVMQIPSRPGENRSGVWVDGEIRPSAP